MRVTGANGESLEYVDRGDPIEEDFLPEDLIVDSQFHELDLSGICPEAAANKLVCLKVVIANTLTNVWMVFDENEHTNTYTAQAIRTQIANIRISEMFWIKLDANCRVKYKMKNAGNWIFAHITIKGWFIKQGGDNLE